MKKSLVLILALVLVFSFSVTALAADFSDIADQPQAVQDAVYKLAALEMVEGYDDGTWRPNDQITRAEFAKIACLAGGFSSSYDALGNVSTPFSDVKVGVWYTGWVNLAYSQGYMKGDPNGTFRPNDPISENEVITVLLRLLGYNDNLAGQWPVDYVRQAGLLGILDDVKIVGSTPALRSTVAVMTDATLGENLVAWTKDKEIFEDRTFTVNGQETTKSLLADSFKGNVYEDQKVELDSTVDPLYSGWLYSNFDKDVMEIDFDPANGSNGVTGPQGMADTFRISGGYNAWDLAGHQVDVIATLKDGDIDELKYVEVKSSAIYVDAIEYNKASKIDLGGKAYTVADKDEDLVEGSLIATISSDDSGDSDLTDGWFKVYLNEDGEAYNAVQLGGATKADTDEGTFQPGIEELGGIVENVDTTENYVDFYTSTDFATEYADTDFDGKDVAVIKDGKISKGLEAVKAGDAVTVLKDAADIDYVLYVNAPGSAAKLSKISGNDFTIGDVAYYVSDYASYTSEGDDYDSVFASSESGLSPVQDIKDALGSTVTPTFGRTGSVVSLLLGEASDKNNVLGVLIDYSITGSANPAVSQIKVFNEAGKVAVYDVVDRAYKLDTGDYKDIEEYEVGSLIKFRLNSDGDIDKAIDISVLTTDETTLPVDEDYKEITINGETFNVSSSTKIFDAQWDEGDLDEVVAVTLEDLLKGDVSTSGDVTAKYMLDGNDVTALVLNDFGASSKGNYGVLKDYGYSTSDFDYAIQLLINNKATDFDSNSDAQTAVKTLEEYDLVAYDLSGDTIEGITPVVSDIDVDAETCVLGDIEGLTLQGGKVMDIDNVSSSQIRLDNVNYKYTSDTVVFDYSTLDNPKEVSYSTVKNINTSRKVVAVYTDDDNNDEVSLIVIFNKDVNKGE